MLPLSSPAARYGGASASWSLAALAERIRTTQFSSEACIVGASLFFTIFCNDRFWAAWAAGRVWSQPGAWFQGLVIAVLLISLHSLLLGLVLTRRNAKPLLALLFIATALAVFFMQRYTVYFDVSMLRNIVHTDAREARELFSPALLGPLLMLGLLPAFVLIRSPLRVRPFRRALLTRLLFLAGALALAVVCIALAFQDLSSLMRNQKEARYLITPANFIVAGARLASSAGAQAAIARTPMGSDAHLGPAWSTRSKPLLLVVVVGETARAANWGLNGYARNTTPELANAANAAQVINFSRVSACGSNTEVSLPCMFSLTGRRDYDESRIRQQESVLHVLERGGIKTLWRDNQSGCKGVCEGLEAENFDERPDLALCQGAHCFDEILLHGLEAQLTKNQRGMVVVLHQLGNHGPAYAQRYPKTFQRFLPACENADLGKCSRDEIVNSYDNALLYTDHFLARTIARLAAQQTHDAALLYVSDHGESLGEAGLYLHGLPYAIAPREQTEVPMTMWLSPGFTASTGIDPACLKKRAAAPVSHDYLAHSMLGLMQVNTSVHERQFDLSAGCRKPA